MPIKIPDGLPGRITLEAEHVPLITEGQALRQDIRPLRILLVNLMPDKIRTETQLLRALGATPLQLEITLLHMATHTSKNTAQEHLTAFYQTLNDVRDQAFDGMIVTGAPVEHLEYQDVGYWPELTELFDWARTHVFSSFFICWGAQAALYHYHAIPKNTLPAKQSGIYPHRVLKPYSPLMTGFDDDFLVPVSRNTDILYGDVKNRPELEILAESEKTGICIVHEPPARRVYMFNHLEYDAETLAREYDRDLKAGMSPNIPFNYFPDNNPSKPPTVRWRAHRSLLFRNWIDLIYRDVPFNFTLKT